MDPWNSFCYKSIYVQGLLTLSDLPRIVVPPPPSFHPASIQTNLCLSRSRPPLTSAINTLLAIRFSSILATCPNHLQYSLNKSVVGRTRVFHSAQRLFEHPSDLIVPKWLYRVWVSYSTPCSTTRNSEHVSVLDDNSRVLRLGSNSRPLKPWSPTLPLAGSKCFNKFCLEFQVF